ncbi:MAG: hypothetical protein RR681_09860 [Lachnospiraceae bacterium]
MNGLSPISKLQQGFSYVQKQDTKLVMKSVAQVEKADIINIFVTDGTVIAQVTDIIKEEYHGKGN